MTSLDLLVLGIVVGSSMLGAWRGFVREAFSLAALMLAFLAAKEFAPALAPLLPGLEGGGLRYAAALVLIFVVVLVAGGLLAVLSAGMLRMAGLGVYDRMLGFAFGLARACAVLVMLTLLAGLTALPASQVWQASLASGPLEDYAVRVKPWLPDDLAALIRFSPAYPLQTGAIGLAAVA